MSYSDSPEQADVIAWQGKRLVVARLPVREKPPPCDVLLNRIPTSGCCISPTTVRYVMRRSKSSRIISPVKPAISWRMPRRGGL